MNRTEEQLNRDLERGADLFEVRGGRERTLEEVLGAARSIRRRRRAGVALVGAAVAAAVAVPIGLTVGPPQATTPPPASTGTPTPAPIPVDRIGLGDLPVGSTPASGWVLAGTWHRPDGGTQPVLPRPVLVQGGGRSDPLRVTAAAAVGPALVATVSTRTGSRALLVRPGHGTTSLGPAATGLARSPRGDLVVFAGPDGRSVTAVEGRAPRVTSFPSPRIAGGSAQVAAVTGEECTLSAPGCVVWINDLGPSPTVTRVPSGATVDLVGAVTRIRSLADIAADGRLTGIVSRSDAGTCSEVERAGRRVWGTCATRLVAFSPDGSRLLGTSAYGDGLGDTELSVLDAATGHVELRLGTAPGAVVTQMTWEDDSHVLATVLQGRRAAIVRIGVGGVAEYAVPPVRSAADVSPFVLPVS